jgi:hypothetical protein
MHAQPMGCGGSITFGGGNLSAAMHFLASLDRSNADARTYEAGNSARIAAFARREQDWAFQSNLAAGEIMQMYKQIRAAEIREVVAQKELESHRKQMEHSKEIMRFLNEEGTERTGKKTNKALYAWMKREVKGLYAQAFQLAFDVAKKAERALQHELNNRDRGYLQFGYLAGKEGLLAGEKLYLDLKRMELAYQELNQREYELTKHVSLLQVDPLALVQLRRTGSCALRLPEALFDLDGPGHYFRRIRSVAVSIPCVAGPYASVNCTLTLRKSSIRKTPALLDGAYPRQNEDERFEDYFGSLQSIVTSSGQNDSGMFDGGARDERYLPFENSGAESEWLLQLPANPGDGEPAQFDYETISDIILHFRYTAREGGTLLRRGALENINAMVSEARAVGSTRLFSVRHEFPTEWARFQAATPPGGTRFELALTLRPEHYPYWSRGRVNAVERVDILARSTKAPVPGGTDVHSGATGPTNKEALVRDSKFGNLLVGRLGTPGTGIPVPGSPTGEIKLFFDDKAIGDLWLAVTWKGA